MALTDEELKDGLLIYVLFLIPSGLLWYKGIKLGKLMDLAKRYNSIFECDRDGTVTLSELTKQTGKPSGVMLSEIELLLSKGFLCGCTLQKKCNPCVILADGIADMEGAAFVNALCPVCGATTRIRSGSSGKCEYCGSPIGATADKQDGGSPINTDTDKEDSGGEYVDVICPMCRTTAKLKSGTSGECEICGNILNADTDKNDGTGFVDIVCPVCKETTSIRAGRSGKCFVCGNPISAETEKAVMQSDT